MPLTFSCFTPTHRPDHLPETYRSLQAQQDANWQWVICPNGPAIGKIPEEITADPRVKVVPYSLAPDEKPRIGALKRFACDQCTNDVLVELDHDDLLMPGVLNEIGKQVKAGAGFVYSDAAVFIERGGEILPVAYGEQFGWETYELRVYGRDLLASRAFDVTPRSLCEVYYAPDHVRAWTREAYYKAGGHDQELTVGDDHELICRTYLTGVRFKHTGGCGYIYRNHPGNTVKSHNDQIQQQQAATRDKYFYKLVDEWTRRHRLAYLDMTLRNPLVKLPEGKLRIKLPDNSLGSIRCFDILPFVAQEYVQAAWEELHRVLAPGGWLCVRAASTEGMGGFQPHFRSHWNEYNFRFASDWLYARELGTIKPKARFQLSRCWSIAPDKNQPRLVYVYADLCALKGQRIPGQVRI